jgi:YD repeat-containing protein
VKKGKKGTRLISQSPMSRYTTFTYDTDRRVTSVTTQLGTAAYSYDATTGEIASVTDPLSNVTTMSYNADGQILSEHTPDVTRSIALTTPPVSRRTTPTRPAP